MPPERQGPPRPDRFRAATALSDDDDTLNSMPMIEKTGDLFELGLPALGHGCNTRGLMGSGIAPIFARRFPGMLEAYQQQCSSGAFTLGKVWVWQATPVVYNMATQVEPGRDARLDAIEQCLTKALEHAHRSGLTALGVPRIGAGIGGLNWPDVHEVLTRVGSASPVDLVVVSLPNAR